MSNRTVSETMHIKEPANYLDHMMKQTRQHHVTLSAMADAKANMLLTMSSLVTTLCLPQLMIDSSYKIAFVVLMLFCLVTIFLACYAVMPKLSLDNRDEQELQFNNSQFNPLFFGDFHQLSFDRYAELMEEAMNNPSRSYELQLREVYAMGQYLAKKKYRLLRYAYLSFLSGFIAAIAAILIQWFG